MKVQTQGGQEPPSTDLHCPNDRAPELDVPGFLRRLNEKLDALRRPRGGKRCGVTFLAKSNPDEESS